jgi:hypothetical protein
MVGKYQTTLAGDQWLRVVNFGLSLPPSSGQFSIITTSRISGLNVRATCDLPEGDQEILFIGCGIKGLQPFLYAGDASFFERSAYPGKGFVKHVLRIRAIRISTSTPASGSTGGNTPSVTPSFHMAVKSFRDCA